MKTGDNLIKSYRERLDRKDKNEQIILNFLKHEKVSTANILSQLLGFKAVSPIYLILKRLVKNGYLSMHPIKDFMIKDLNLYGITQLGLTMSLNDKDDPFKIRPFEPSHLNINTLRHRLDIQEISIIANKNGYQWRSMHNVKMNKGDKCPDSLMRKEGKIYAIEVERTPKSPRRYKEIIEQYIKQKGENKWQNIVYLFPDEQMKDRVKRIFLKVDSVIINGILTKVKSNQIEQVFLFATYADFVNGTWNK